LVVCNKGTAFTVTLPAATATGKHYYIKNIGVGTVTLEGNLADVVSEPVMGKNPSNVNCSCIVAIDEAHKLILCKRAADSTSMVYNFVDGTWSKWNVNVTGKGWGAAGGMFSVAATMSPAYVGAYHTTYNQPTGDTITPILYTPALNFGDSYSQKYMRKIMFSGRGITEIKIYTRMSPDEDFALWTTVSYPEYITELTGDHRFAECYIKITGNTMFLLKNLSVELDIGNPIYQTQITTGALNNIVAFSENTPSADTITRSSGSFLTDGFKAGQRITVSGSHANDASYTIASVVAGTITLVTSDDVTTEAKSTDHTVTIVSVAPTTTYS